jgi:hypothetical protein
LGKSGKAENFLSEEVSSSPDKTENTVSIPSIKVKTSAHVIAQSSRVAFEGLERARCCQEP